ncbi:MAG: response regulator transcription factor [Actinomycetales bacterium]|jgi:DNA-binding response OmpR family regulator
MRVLVVEDDPAVSEPLIAGLERHGFEVFPCAYAMQAVPAVQQEDPNVVVLDLGLPDGDGLDVLKEIRRFSDVPVIILTARGEETDRIVGLELGSDDYMVKPFSVRELAARIRAISRRRRAEPASETDRIVVDRVRHSVTVDGNPVDLTAKEFDLLSVLAEEPGRVISRQELFSRVWDPVWTGTGKTLDVHIASLRRKLGDTDLIETVRGVGYRMVER